MNTESKIILVNFTGPNRGVVKPHPTKPKGPRGPKGGGRRPRPTPECVVIDLFAKKAA